MEGAQDATLLKVKDDPRLIDVKSTLPVPVTTDTRAERLARPGAMDRKRKAKTEDLIGFLYNWIEIGETKSLRSAGPWLRAQMADGVYDAILKSISRNLAGIRSLNCMKEARITMLKDGANLNLIPLLVADQSARGTSCPHFPLAVS